LFLCRVNNAFEKNKEKTTKKYYVQNKDKICEQKKTAYHDELEKSHMYTAAHSKDSYDKDLESGAKSTARSKTSYDKDLESGAK